MGRTRQVFAQEYADIWQYSPFPPSAQVAQFLQQFTQSGQFDADLFWAFVCSTGTSQANPQALCEKVGSWGSERWRVPA